MINETVILLHGLARSKYSMSRMAKALRDCGYTVLNIAYHSTKYPIEVLADSVINKALLQDANSDKIHFVTHSLGGILVRQYLSRHSIANLGRVVMLGPPNQGSEVVDALHKIPGYEWINGPAGMQLGTDKHSLPNRLGPAEFELGIIAGTKSINLILSRLLPGENDGKVTVERTKLNGMRDHITVPVAHPFLMLNKKIIKHTIYFLQHGCFIKN